LLVLPEYPPPLPLTITGADETAEGNSDDGDDGGGSTDEDGVGDDDGSVLAI